MKKATMDKSKSHYEKSCPICLKPYNIKQTYILECIHKFHKQCLKNIILKEESDKCPICSKKIKRKEQVFMTH